MRIIIGSVQMGLCYGVANTNGKMTDSSVSEILDFANRNGINAIDTAFSYGDSEDVIGRVIEYDKWDIITKTPHFHGEHINDSHLRQLRVAFDQSLDKLRRQNVYGLLVHNCDDLLKPGGAKLFEQMEDFRYAGKVSKLGVSVYTGEQIDRILNEFDIDIIQLPINILDQRLINSGHLGRLKEFGVEIHARSIFLQGLLLMPLCSIPEYFQSNLKSLERTVAKAHELSISRLELTLGFVQSINEIDAIVIGVNTRNQLQQIIDTGTVEVNHWDFMECASDDQDFLNPSKWLL